MLAILQARTSSQRLPGKVLSPVLGTPLILRALERISRSALVDRIVLATSDDPSDDMLALVVSEAGYDVHRGPLDDVLTRFVQVLERFDDETVVRLTGDNVLCDPRVIDEVIGAHLEGGADYTANTLERTFPRGLDVEVFGADVLRAVDRSAVDAAEREHVTLGIYRRPEQYRLRSVTQPIDRSDLRWTVDHPADLEFARTVYSHLHGIDETFGQQQVVKLLEAHPGLALREQDLS